MKRKIFFILLIHLFLTSWGRAQDTFPFTGTATSPRVNVRAGESQNFEGLTELQQGEDVVVVGKNYSWYKIKLPVHARSFVAGKYIQNLGDGIGTVIGDNLNIRARASTQASVVGRLRKGDLIRILNEKEEWVQIEPVDQSYGWVLEDYITFKSQQIPAPRVVEPPIRNIYKRKQIQAQKAAQAAAVPESSAPVAPTPIAASQAERVSATGVIDGLGAQSLTQNIRHQLKVDGNPAYYLKGYRAIMDGFLNYQVIIEGEVLPDIQAPHPVLLVTKIQLVL